MKLILLILLATATFQLYAQPPCYQRYPSYYASMIHLANLPPLNTGMGFGELIAHVALDSICRTLSSVQVDSFISARTSWDDTLKSVMKSVTALVDSDPLTLFGITHTNCEWRMSFPKDIRRVLYSQVLKWSPNSGIDAAIASCDYILRVTVRDTMDLIDTSAISARTARIATADINQVIMGHTYPLCTSEGNTTGTPSVFECITFDARRENIENAREILALTTDSVTVNSLMPKHGKQYLAFLRLARLCSDTNKVYFSIFPATWVGSQSGLFEIDSTGKIVDSTDCFGLGINPSVSDVIATLSTRIASIKSWVP